MFRFYFVGPPLDEKEPVHLAGDASSESPSESISFSVEADTVDEAIEKISTLMGDKLPDDFPVKLQSVDEIHE